MRKVAFFAGPDFDELIDEIEAFLKNKKFKNISITTQPLSPEGPNELMRVNWIIAVVYKNKKGKKAKNNKKSRKENKDVNKY
ncbi:hypothetical protein LMB49_10780 [Limosilactobacillus reuteri]|uniref:hypothetical protein n=1 Tax=Limosilactobacillus reuteri TaxID=1598 RepID=UPI001E5BE67B|nr:hypothetical protein [Limosilactobacillus reuteri]MCC4370555.1 hypothetical protein [Limosilactobacillus reuteri]MCC4371876.1 hypothetical protein [Limosilactobacillus reuteri]MCC4509347.1 hypothetical protein [Limosilactobacillus reuteri]MCC4509390.1 hypothetical protein [Limosilactobacillus reuteri]